MLPCLPELWVPRDGRCIMFERPGLNPAADTLNAPSFLARARKMGSAIER
jgi:hypothetical protein